VIYLRVFFLDFALEGFRTIVQKPSCATLTRPWPVFVFSSDLIVVGTSIT
jgi:hypothetical protein